MYTGAVSSSSSGGRKAAAAFQVAADSSSHTGIVRIFSCRKKILDLQITGTPLLLNGKFLRAVGRLKAVGFPIGDARIQAVYQITIPTGQKLDIPIIVP